MSARQRLDNGLTCAVVYNSLPVDLKRGILDGVYATETVSIIELREVVLASVPAAHRCRLAMGAGLDHR